jgi:hypothetical protein
VEPSNTVRSLVKKLQSQLPGFSAKSRLLFRTPVEHLLCGFYFDSSAYVKERFYLEVFVQPLYLSSDHIVLTFGGRMRTGGILREITSESIEGKVLTAIQSEGLPFLSKFRMPADMAFACEQPSAFSNDFCWPTEDINVWETAAYSWFLAGNMRKSLEYLKRIDLNVQHGDDKRGWVLDLQNRANHISAMLRDENEKGVRSLLNSWEAETARSLGITSYLQSR